MEDFLVKTLKLTEGPFEVNALHFIPNRKKNDLIAIFTHGYTASKSSILTWGSRFAGAGFESIIFDLPGHYLGSFNEVESFEDFQTYAPNLFKRALEKIESTDYQNLLLGGHSLGALLSLKTLENNFANESTFNICVGLGLGPEETIHAFDSDFYRKTFAFREQLTSPAMRGDKILPWIKNQKQEMQVRDKRIHLITGKDDVVVAPNGSERLMDLLLEKGNFVTLARPNRMSHHQPELAGPHIMAFVRDNILKKD